MTISAGDIVSMLMALAAIITALYSGRRANQEAQTTAKKIAADNEKAKAEAEKAKAEADTAKAEAAKLYQQISQNAVQSQGLLQEQIDQLRTRLDEKDKTIVEQNHTIQDLLDKVKRMEDLLSSKDGRIEELEKQTAEQATEIEGLRQEIQVLRLKRK